MSVPHIVFPTFTTAIGGAERQLLALAEFLSREIGLGVTIATVEDTGAMADTCRESGIRLLTIPRPHATVNGWRRFAKVLASLNPTVIMPYHLAMNVNCNLVWKLTGAHACFWNQRSDGWKFSDSPSHRLAGSLATVVTANSPGALSPLVKTLGIPREKIRLVTNAVRLEPPRLDKATWRQRLGCGPEEIIVTMIANFFPHKDFETALKAFRRILDGKNTVNRTRLILAGKPGPESGRVERWIGELGLSDHVRQPGAVEDVTGLWRASDIGLLTSKNEGTPNAIVEAMLCELPVVSTSRPDLLGPIHPVQVATPGNAEAIADSLGTLAANPELRLGLGRSNRTLTLKEFCPVRRLAEFWEIIRSTL